MIRPVLFVLLPLSLLGGQTVDPPPASRPVVSVSEPAGQISADLLRHPITEKARQLLLKALETTKSGDHESAIEQLQAILARYPESAPYVHSIIGVEYLKANRFKEAINAFEQAVALLPHDAVNRYNLGLSLVCNGEIERGAREVRRAIEMDPSNPGMRTLLDALIEQKLISATEP